MLRNEAHKGASLMAQVDTYKCNAELKDGLEILGQRFPWRGVAQPESRQSERYVPHRVKWTGLNKMRDTCLAQTAGNSKCEKRPGLQYFW